MNKSNYRLFLIFSLVLFLSVGYAVVNSVSLTVTGSVGTGSENLDVYFTGTTEVSNSSKATATASGTSATASLANMVLNEAITLEYEIKNNEKDVDAELVVTVPLSNDYFDISISEGSILSGDDAAGHPSPVSYVLGDDYDIVYLSDSDGGHSIPTVTPTQTYTVGAGDTFVLMITVKMVKTPVNSVDSSFDFNVGITANPVSATL